MKPIFLSLVYYPTREVTRLHLNPMIALISEAGNFNNDDENGLQSVNYIRINVMFG